MRYEQSTIADESIGNNRATVLLSLVGGRRDIYARRYHNTYTGRAGYSVPCANEYIKDECYKSRRNKRKLPCSLCEHRAHYKLNEQIVNSHLLSENENAPSNIAIFPLTDGKVSFVMFRLQGADWMERALFLEKICIKSNLQLCKERDAEGNGRCWLFFEQSTDVGEARGLAYSIVSEALRIDHKLGYGLYDCIYPSQSRQMSPQFGYGTPCPLPLQAWGKASRLSCFIDSNGRPYEDQWLYISLIKKVTDLDIKRLTANIRPLGLLMPESGIVMTAETTPGEKEELETYSAELSNALNDKAARFPATVDIVFDSVLHIPKEGFNEYTLDALMRLAAYENPQYRTTSEGGRPTFGTPVIICDAKETEYEIQLPRGCAPALMRMFKGHINIDLIDRRYAGNKIDVAFNGKLFDEQIPAVEALDKKNTGILNVPTAFGKTVSAAALICRKKTNTLVLVPTNALLGQWVSSLNKFISFGGEEPTKTDKRGRTQKTGFVGRLGNGTNDLHGIIDIATMQSVYGKDGKINEAINNYGLIIVDECHHLSADTYKATLQCTAAKYIYGLTATAKRTDGHQNSVYMQLGSIRYSVPARDHAEKKHKFSHTLVPCFTELRIKDTRTMKIHEYYDAINTSTERNALIINNVIADMEKEKATIVLTERVEHAHTLSDMLREKISGEYIYELTGSDTQKQKALKLTELREYPANKPLAVIATGKYVGEGLDIPRLAALHITNPVVWRGTLAQYAGRLHRDYEGKDEVLVYDYIDANIRMLATMFFKRIPAYVDVGYKLRAINSDPSTFCEVLNGREYPERLLPDIAAARRNIAIVSRRIETDQVRKFLPVLQQAAASGVKCYIVTSDTKYYKRDVRGALCETLQQLAARGVKISFKNDFPITGVVLDKSVAYYGSGDPLGAQSADAVCLRAESPDLCARLINVMSTAL